MLLTQRPALWLISSAGKEVFLILTGKGFIFREDSLTSFGDRAPNANDEALHRCKTALEQKDRGDYAGAQKTMCPLWKGIGEPPKLTALDPSVAAEVLLCVGILTSWIGSKNQIRDAQELAKNLITQSMTYFESSRDMTKVAVAQSEIAYCYWREGALNEDPLSAPPSPSLLQPFGFAQGRLRGRGAGKAPVSL